MFDTVKLIQNEIVENLNELNCKNVNHKFEVRISDPDYHNKIDVYDILNR